METKTGLILEGGSMRGMFTAGVTDVFMEHGIRFDGAIGVSAGALFGCNYKSHQPGRAIRYNKKYCNDKRYGSFRSLLKTGNFYNEKFCYHEVPEHLDPFDNDTYQTSPMEFYITCTDVRTGKPVYHKSESAAGKEIEWFRASGSLPLFARIVKIGDLELLDGGLSDSIPLKYFESLGYNKNVVILTQPKEYIKGKNKLLPLVRIALRKYPNAINAIATRHTRYNETTKYIAEREAAGEVFVIRPPQALNIGSIEHDPAELERVYQLGRKTAEKYLTQVQDFLKS
ncbi:MAG: patatin family protein [Lachnospiraceae bacterium]|nr:patatin family protein [Lachnospiraceae bacterium]